MERAAGAFGYTFLSVIDIVLNVIQWGVLIWVILSWIVFFGGQSSFRWRYKGFFNVILQLNEIFGRICYPMLRPFRRLLPPHKTAGIDWSPLLLLLTIYFIRTFLRLAFW